MNLCPLFDIFLPNLPDLPQFHKYTRASINWVSDGLLIWAGFHLMWNVKFNTMNDFLRNFPNLPQFPKFTKTGLTRPADGLCTWIRLCLMWNVEFYTLDDFLCIDAHDLSYLGLIFLTCLSSQNRYKLTLRWPLHLSKVSFDVKCRI